jgi:hypothetical protein
MTETPVLETLLYKIILGVMVIADPKLPLQAKSFHKFCRICSLVNTFELCNFIIHFVIGPFLCVDGFN